MISVSFSNDEEAQGLAESYGAEILLDKMKLQSHRSGDFAVPRCGGLSERSVLNHR